MSTKLEVWIKNIRKVQYLGDTKGYIITLDEYLQAIAVIEKLKAALELISETSDEGAIAAKMRLTAIIALAKLELAIDPDSYSNSDELNARKCQAQAKQAMEAKIKPGKPK